MYLFGCLYTPPRIQLLSKSQGKHWLILSLFLSRNQPYDYECAYQENKDSLAKSINFNSIWLKNRLYYSQIEQFSFDLAIEHLAVCYYPPGLRTFELSARAVQFFKTCTGKILRIWGNFRQKDFEEKNILCIFAPNCNINK